tara:strand:+ start:2894 stop:3244 length:351 start_codon:yes stop_codon:yes gene_type:complete
MAGICQRLKVPHGFLIKEGTDANNRKETICKRERQRGIDRRTPRISHVSLCRAVCALYGAVWNNRLEPNGFIALRKHGSSKGSSTNDQGLTALKLAAASFGVAAFCWAILLIPLFF